MDVSELLTGMPQEVAHRLKIGALIPASSEEYEKMRLRWRNEVAGSLGGYDCPACKNRGYTSEMRDGAIVSVECPCMTKRRSIRRMEQSGLGDMLSRYTFEHYKTPELWQKKAKERAMRYCQDNAEKWFIASGCVGSGKTHLCTAICSELIKSGTEVRYMRWKDDSRKLKATVNESEKYSQMIEPLKSVCALYIDDLWKSGNGGVTKADIDLAFEILNARYMDKKMLTIISTELTVSDLLSIDEAVGSRIYERSKSSCIELTGNKNWRLRGEA